MGGGGGGGLTLQIRKLRGVCVCVSVCVCVRVRGGEDCEAQRLPPLPSGRQTETSWPLTKQSSDNGEALAILVFNTALDVAISFKNR